ncbi:MAG: response regulator transcription factor [Verrucomicrobia bacterium]|nr:response regulator transcription factor [Verrucomicrobiota bacterium]
MTTSARILVIEDELPMRTVLRDCLERQGYRVLLAGDGVSGLEKALHEQPDLIVLDVMMPRLDGFAVCAELRRLANTVPILILTAKGRVEDRVTGLDVGADDFLAKPFSRDELLARVRALLRRVQRQARALKEVTLGPVRIDFTQQRAWRGTRPLYLTAKEFAMLRLLAETPGEPVSRDRFLDVVWGYTAFPTTRTVDKHVASLRAKLEADPDRPRWIQTVHAVGYRLELTPDAGPRAQG